jgi:hypothetical protein
MALVPCEKAQKGWFWCKVLVPFVCKKILPKAAEEGNNLCKKFGDEAVGVCEAAGLGPEDPFADVCAAAVKVTVTKACEKALKALGKYTNEMCNGDMGCGGYTVPMVSQISADWHGRTDVIPPMVMVGHSGAVWYNGIDWFMMHDVSWNSGVTTLDVGWQSPSSNESLPPNVTVGLADGQVWLFNYSTELGIAGDIPVDYSNLTQNWVQLGENPHKNVISGLSTDWNRIEHGAPLAAVAMNTNVLETYNAITGWKSSPANMDGSSSKTYTSVFEARWVCGDQPSIVYGTETGHAGMYVCKVDGATCACSQILQKKPIDHVEKKKVMATQLSVEWSLFESGECDAPSAVWTFGQYEVWMYNGCTNDQEMVQIAPRLKDKADISQLAVNWAQCLQEDCGLRSGDNNCIEIVMSMINSVVYWLPALSKDFRKKEDWKQLREKSKKDAVSQMSVNFQSDCATPALVVGLESGELAYYNQCHGGWQSKKDNKGACISRMNVYSEQPTDLPSVVLSTNSGAAIFLDWKTDQYTIIHKATTTTTTLGSGGGSGSSGDDKDDKEKGGKGSRKSSRRKSSRKGKGAA